MGPWLSWIERDTCNVEAKGSIPFGSTNIEILSYLTYMIQETIVVRDNEFVENEIWVGEI